MDDARLRFTEANDGSARLRFGEDAGGATPGGSATLRADAGLGGFGPVTLRAGARLAADVGFADDFPCALQLAWDANVSRVERHESRHHWQEGTPLQAGTRQRWQAATPQTMQLVILHTRWQEGERALRPLRAHWQQNTPLPTAQRHHWQEAEPLRAALRTLWQSPPALRAAQCHHWQEGAPLRAATRHHWAEMLRLRAAQRHWWQEGQPARHAAGLHWHQQAQPLHHAQRHWWNEAKKPCGGRSGSPWDVADDEIICYDPDTLARLQFWQPWEAPLARLVFVCEYSGGVWPPVPHPALVVIPTLRSYIVVNTIDIIRARDGLPLPCDAFSMSLDADSWTWSWQGSFTAPVAAAITPGADGNPDGEPVAVWVTINGTRYHLLAESWTRSREFAKTRINVRGRGRNALLAAPYAYESLHTNAAAATAQQLMEQALTINGVSSGWTLDFQIADWLVPAGGWNLRADPISAILDVADAARALVLPHRTDEVLRILPRYNPAPWHWAADATPDVELPADVVQTEGVEWQTLPDYDRIIIAGTTADGIAAQVTRAGQPGSLPMEMQTHPLITAEPPARARGIAALAQAGRIATTTLAMPVLPESGIIEPGHMVRYLDRLQQQPILGAVRSVQLQWSRPVLRQTITLESHIYEGLGT